MQVPAARPDEQRRDLVLQAVLLGPGVQRDGAIDRIDQVRLAFDTVPPGRRVGILEVGHEHPGAGVQSVDHHLPVDRPGDLDPPVDEIGRCRRNAPVRVFAHGTRRLVGSPAARRRRSAPGVPLSRPATPGESSRTCAEGRRRKRAPPASGSRVPASPASAEHLDGSLGPLGHGVAFVSCATHHHQLYVEEHGEGEPLLLIEGLGQSMWAWREQVPVFARPLPDDRIRHARDGAFLRAGRAVRHRRARAGCCRHSRRPRRPTSSGCRWAGTSP